MASVSRLQINNILPSIKCSNCEKYVELSKMGEHICDTTKRTYQENPKDYAYSSSFPDVSASLLVSDETINEMEHITLSHNKAVSSSEVSYDNDAKNKKDAQKKRVFERLNTVTSGPLGLHNHLNINTKLSKYNQASENSFTSPEAPKSAKARNRRLQPYRWPVSTSSQSSISTFNVSPVKENYTKPLSSEKNKSNIEIEHQTLSPISENIEKISTLKDKSNLTQFKNNKNIHLNQKSKTKNESLVHHSSETLKKESKFPDENSERHLMEWARRDKELSSKFIEKAPNPVITIQEHNLKNTYPKIFNEKKTINNSKHACFFERNSNSTAFSTSSNISRDEKTSLCSMSSPDSELSILNPLMEHKIAAKNELCPESFDKVLNDMENSIRTFYTRSDDTLESYTKNDSQKNLIKNRYLSDFHCKRCNKYIEGKSIRCIDGKISGRFHRECFKCFESSCQNLFTSSEVYVFEGEPYCAKHYHILNKSLCAACKEGIEGKCIQTEIDEKYHFYCFTCYSCKKQLNDEYFDIDGKTYCENDMVKLLSANTVSYQKLEKRKTRIFMMGAF